MISREFLNRLLDDRRSRTELERSAGVYRGFIRDIVTDRIRPKRGDPRIAALGRVLGLDLQECFRRAMGDDDEL